MLASCSFIGSSPRPRGTHRRWCHRRRVCRFIPAPAGNTGWGGATETRSTVHPRARGEHCPVEDLANAVSGSSPRPRGTLDRKRERRPVVRFIPAPAGNTGRERQRHADRPVHPRARGEHEGPPNASAGKAGSSPRPRGTRSRTGYRSPGNRFIPAPAGNTGRWWGSLPGCTVHPRARGEHGCQSAADLSLDGSSPRPRGTRATGRRGRRQVRFIPAPAGNTRSRSWRDRAWTVHPRARGEHSTQPIEVRQRRGSSPRPRGTRSEHLERHLFLRFIPAPAGNTAGAAGTRACIPVHPRARGEHARRQRGTHSRAGSSPRPRGTREHAQHRARVRRFIPAPAGNTVATQNDVRHIIGSSPRPRGTLADARHVQREGRFIPAPAGNTSARSSAGSPTAVHPRARGEHHRAIESVKGRDGSSPRPRGTQPPERDPLLAHRFIPAPAGNTSRSGNCRAGRTVHPRARGEHCRVSCAKSASPGSSPRPRGTLGPAQKLLLLRRFIPAPAGNTRRTARERRRASVHPRARGEHSSARIRMISSSGSSPRPRGTPAEHRKRPSPARFIPAPAGNTPRPPPPPSRSPVHPRARGEHIRSGCGYPSVHRFIPAPAGNTSATRYTPCSPPVHPRARGEHIPFEQQRQILFGSSPRPRGTHPGATHSRRTQRFIPAPAGNTKAALPALLGDPVHPRARGEHARAAELAAPVTGSSPRPRGTPPQPRSETVRHRFIPAPAGNTQPRGRGCPVAPVHPRARGEHTSTRALRTKLAGSSPRPRGTRNDHPSPPRDRRFIPAPAGNTAGFRRSIERYGVHPRARGEHPPATSAGSLSAGSSPRPRGTQRILEYRAGLGRFIPAPAGNTSPRRQGQRTGPVHPRARGEHDETFVTARGECGSSPRPRGTQVARARVPDPDRFIPAPAGNTASPPPAPDPPAVHPRARGEH